MLCVIFKHTVEGLSFVEKINKDIDGFYDCFLGGLCVSFTTDEDMNSFIIRSVG